MSRHPKPPTFVSYSFLQPPAWRKIRHSVYIKKIIWSFKFTVLYLVAKLLIWSEAEGNLVMVETRIWLA